MVCLARLRDRHLYQDEVINVQNRHASHQNAVVKASASRLGGTKLVAAESNIPRRPYGTPLLGVV